MLYYSLNIFISYLYIIISSYVQPLHMAIIMHTSVHNCSRVISLLVLILLILNNVRSALFHIIYIIFLLVGFRWATELFVRVRWWTLIDLAENLLICMLWIFIYYWHTRARANKYDKQVVYQQVYIIYQLLYNAGLRPRNIIHTVNTWQQWTTMSTTPAYSYIYNLYKHKCTPLQKRSKNSPARFNIFLICAFIVWNTAMYLYCIWLNLIFTSQILLIVPLSWLLPQRLGYGALIIWILTLVWQSPLWFVWLSMSSLVAASATILSHCHILFAITYIICTKEFFFLPVTQILFALAPGLTWGSAWLLL